MTQATIRAVLGASLAAGCALVAALAFLPRARESSAIEPSLGNAGGTPSSAEVQLVEPQDGVSAPESLRALRDTAIDVRAADPRVAADSAVRALARRLRSGDYRRTTFETEARARMPCLPAGSLARRDDSDLALAVARGVLARVAPATLDERRALVREDLPALRAALQDELVAVAEQAAASLAALGDDADRARLIADAIDATAPRAALVARIGLESLEGPGAGLALVEAAAARADGPFLAAFPAWAHAHAGELAPAERAQCADSLRAIAGDASRDAAARSRALSGLRALDPEQATVASLAWLRDANADAALVRGACASVNAGHVDPPTVLALTREPALAVERRIEIACAFLGSAQAKDGDPDLVAQVRAEVEALGASDRFPALAARELDVSVNTPVRR